MSNFKTNLSRAYSKVMLSLKKHSPEILITTGVIGMVGSAVLACIETTKAKPIIEDHKENVGEIHYLKDSDNYPHFGEKEATKELAVTYGKTAIKLAGLYAPSVALGTLSVTCIFAGSNILRKRNVALAAAYATVDKSFKEYRNRVIDRFGENVDYELKYGIKTRKVETTETDPETGKEKKVKKEIKIVDPNITNEFAVYFDKTNPNWESVLDYDLAFLRAQQNYANDLLGANGHLFLNEVYDMIGVPRTQAGQIVGWVKNNKDPKSDGYVDFRIHEVCKETEDGYEDCIIIDPNVDGSILNLI